LIQQRALQGVELMNMIRKAQMKRIERDNVQGQAKFIEILFGIAA
jgi:hypothetical protein